MLDAVLLGKTRSAVLREMFMNPDRRISFNELVRRVKAVSDIPVGVGLGVRSREQAAEIGAYADGVIVGSALVSALKDGIPAVRSLTEELADGVRQRITA